MRQVLRRRGGFTLVELMIALAVAAILASVAIPAYRQHVMKSRRADGRAALMALAQAMERFYTERGTFAGATLGSSGIYGSSSTEGYYTLSITAQTAAGYTITAAPAGAQTGDACATYTYDQAGTRGLSGSSKTVAECW
jgi:type IV pilus assembly protein PilE